MNTELMKAVEHGNAMTLLSDVVEALHIIRQFIAGERNRVGDHWGIRSAMDAHDTIRAHILSQDAEIARLKSAWHVETLNEKDRLIALQELENDRVKSRLAAAKALLQECDEVARKRGDKYGLCDAIDNDGEPYQSAHLAAHLKGAGDE